MKKGAVLALILMMALAFGGIFLHSRNQQAAIAQRLDEVKQEGQALEKEKEALRQQIEKTKIEYEKKIRPQATEEFIFLDLEPRLYTNVFPLMEKYEIRGVLPLSAEVFPGDDGCITAAQFLEMVDKGWTTCAICTDLSDIDGWYEQLLDALGTINFRVPQSVFVLDSDYNADIDAKLRELGFAAIIYDSKYDSDMLFTEPDEEKWSLGAYSWNFSGIRRDLQAFIANGKNRAFYVNFNEDKNSDFKLANFRNMLNFVRQYQKNGSLNVTGFSDAAEYRREKAAENVILEQERDQKLQELYQKKDRLQAEINQIYQQWSA